MKVKILKACELEDQTFAVGQEYDLEMRLADKLVHLGKAQFTE